MLPLARRETAEQKNEVVHRCSSVVTRRKVNYYAAVAQW